MEDYLKIYKNREEYEKNSGASIFAHVVDSAILINNTPDPCATPNVEVSVIMPNEVSRYTVLNLFRYNFFPSWDDKMFDVYVDGEEAVLESIDMSQEKIEDLINEGRLVIIDTITVGSEQMDVYQLVSVPNKRHKIKFVFDSSFANEQYCFEAFNICDRYYTSTTNIVYDNPSKFTCIEDGGCMH